MDREELERLATEIVPLGDNPYGSLAVGTVGIIGAGRPSGFGFNIGAAVLLAHPNNNVLLTEVDSQMQLLGDNVHKDASGYDNARVATYPFDVLNPEPLPASVDHLVICAVYRTREVIVEGFQRTVSMQTGLVNKAVWAVSFAGHDFPGYKVGVYKRGLEQMILYGEQLLPGVAQNVLSFGPQHTVSTAFIRDFDAVFFFYEDQGLKPPTMTQMAFGAVNALSENHEREIISLDGGLRDMIARMDGQEREREYGKSMERYRAQIRPQTE